MSVQASSRDRLPLQKLGGCSQTTPEPTMGHNQGSDQAAATQLYNATPPQTGAPVWSPAPPRAVGTTNWYGCLWEWKDLHPHHTSNGDCSYCVVCSKSCALPLTPDCIILLLNGATGIQSSGTDECSWPWDAFFCDRHAGAGHHSVALPQVFLAPTACLLPYLRCALHVASATASSGAPTSD